jgi:hypothetical protein
MPDDDSNPEPDKPRVPAETFECPMCRQRAPAAQSIVMGGRRLCFACASGWFEDDDEDDSSE